jgi:hypothetical protein
VTTQQLVWLNKLGQQIFNDTVAIENVSISAASLIRMTRTEVFLQVRGTENTTNTFNLLRRYVSSRAGVTFTDTPLEPGEVLTTSLLAGPLATTGGSLPTPDKTGFFSYTLGIPLLTNEFVVRRYSNK